VADGTRSRDILEAARTLFAERGYLGTSMKDIAAVLGIRAPSLYNHVGSKQDLLRAIMVDTMEALIAIHEEAVAVSEDPAEQLRAAVGAHVRYQATHAHDVKIANAEIWHLDEPARSQVRDLRRRYARAWRDIVDRGVQEGRFRTPPTQLATFTLMGMGVSLGNWATSETGLTDEELVEQYAELAVSLVLQPVAG